MSIRAALERQIQFLALPTPFEFHIASKADLAALDRVNAECVDDVGVDIYGRQDIDFFQHVMTRGAEIVAVRRAEDYVGYCIAGPATRMSEVFAQDADAGLLYGTAVSASARGLGLQRKLIRLRLQALSGAGFEYFKAFVSPWNHRSICNLLAEGFSVSACDRHHYGVPRFIVEARSGSPLDPSTQREPAHLQLPPVGDLAKHEALLSDGWRGVSVTADAPPKLAYCR